MNGAEIFRVRYDNLLINNIIFHMKIYMKK